MTTTDQPNTFNDDAYWREIEDIARRRDRGEPEEISDEDRKEMLDYLDKITETEPNAQARVEQARALQDAEDRHDLRSHLEAAQQLAQKTDQPAVRAFVGQALGALSGDHL